MTLTKNLRQSLIVLAISIVLVPSIVFLGGLWLAGPYEGENGVLGMLGHIYTDALSGKLSALLLLLGPLLLILLWQVAFASRRHIINLQQQSSEAAQNPDQGQ
jgi:hypothetical protein